MLVTYHIRLDCNRAGNQAAIYCRRGELGRGLLSISLYAGGERVCIGAGDVCVLTCLKPDGTQVLQECTVEKGAAQLSINRSMTACAGDVTCQLHCYGQDGGLLYSPCFTLCVEDTATGEDSITSTADFSALQGALLQADRYRRAWSNPVVQVHNGEQPAATLTVGDDHVLLDLTVQQGQPGEAAYIGSESGCLVETASDGVLVAGRRIIVGTDAPENCLSLRPGDIYVKLDE